MTTLAVIGDIHAEMDRLDQVLARIEEVAPDGILLVGDLGSDDLSLEVFRTPERDARYLASVDGVLGACRALGRPVLWVPGNHDLPELEGPGNVDGGVDRIGTLAVAGVGGSGPHRFGFCYEWDEATVRAREIPACDVLLCHCPPRDTPLDRVPARSEHVGSLAIRERALRHEGFLVCGHIHESPGGALVGACLCLNVGGLGAPWGRTQVGFIRRGDRVDEAWHEDLESGEIRRWSRRRGRARPRVTHP